MTHYYICNLDHLCHIKIGKEISSLIISSTPPCILVQETLPKILKIKVIKQINKKWGITSMFTIFRLAYMYCGTAACILEAVPCVQVCGSNGNTCKNTDHINKIGIKCYKTNVCRLPSYMAHVLHMLMHFNMLIHIYNIHSI